MNKYNEIRLIDFGSSIFESEMDSIDDRQRRSETVYHCFETHWNMDGYRFSYRDDVFRALMIVAYIMSGSSFFERLCSWNFNELYEYKLSGFTFDGFSNIEESVSDQLSLILSTSRSMSSVKTKPDYKFLTDLYKSISDNNNSQK